MEPRLYYLMLTILRPFVRHNITHDVAEDWNIGTLYIILNARRLFFNLRITDSIANNGAVLTGWVGLPGLVSAATVTTPVEYCWVLPSSGADTCTHNWLVGDDDCLLAGADDVTVTSGPGIPPADRGGTRTDAGSYCSIGIASSPLPRSQHKTVLIDVLAEATN